ncbi:MAG: DUF1640 protein [Magnetococcales bacterium]|nr:DUF1640 protein [Magnetococcales bacterium]HIJ83663.1 DUF1640 domain-containing protein [Magnetococcales bacterium]
MSATIAFDTYAYVKKLRDAGVDELQAGIQAEALVALVEDRLATKQDMFTLKRDLTAVEASLRRDLADVEASLRRDIKEIDAKIETTRAELKRDIKEIDVKAETRFRELDAKIETSKAETLARMDAKIETSKVDTIKWTAGMFAAQTALILGTMFAMLKMNQPNPQPTGYPSPPTQEMRLPAASIPTHVVPQAR